MRKQGFPLAIILMAFFVLPSCGKKENNIGKAKPKTEVESKTLSALGISVFRLNPTKKTRADYQWFCAPCHGIFGEGNGINSSRMPVKPINHKDPVIMSRKSDKDIFTAIFHGGLAIEKAPCMPPFKHTIDKKTIASLVGYLRELCQCEDVSSGPSTPSIRLL